jgi:uncharacterized protein
LVHHTILWRSVDRPGHETAHLISVDSGWRLTGSAVFAHEGNPCALHYAIHCDAGWRTTAATISGWVGNQAVSIELTVTPEGTWRFNGSSRPEVARCTDIDLAFSPSTNLLPIRRLHLEVGDSAQVRAAWLRFPELDLEPLEQVYRRVDATTYEYESGGGVFKRTLQLNSAGFVRSYPGLWEAVDLGPAGNRRK